MKISKKEGLKNIKVYHNKTLFWIIVVLFILLAILVVYIIKLQMNEIENQINNQTQLANPASVFCIENKGKLEIVNNINGSYGLCKFDDGSYCEEWQYFRKECTIGMNFAKDFCNIDLDCIPASCCHANSCVNKANIPDCKGMFCTMNCEPNTLDCGQASCKCTDNHCNFVINNDTKKIALSNN